MVNLLKDEEQKTKFKEYKDKKSAEEMAREAKEAEQSKKTDSGEKPISKVDPKKYKDLEGVTLSKLEFGFWFIKNQPLFMKVFLAVLFLIGVLTWPRFLWTYGHYIIFGMRADNKLALELTDNTNNLHDAVMAQAARDIVATSLTKLKNHDGSYDILVKIKNPNAKFWGNFKYYFTDGNEKFGQAESFIYPGEEKNIVSLAIESDSINSNISFVVEGANWSRITAHTIPDWPAYKADRFQVAVSDIIFTPARATILSEKLSLNELSFTVKNNSAFNYYKCGFLIILHGQSEVIATSYATIDRFMSGQEQGVSLTLPGYFSRVTDIDVIPDLDIYNDDNFIRFEGGVGGEK